MEVRALVEPRGAGSLRYTRTRRLEQDYALHDKVLGSGFSGNVFLASGRGDGRRYAVKSLRKVGLSSRRREDLKNEAELYLTLDHPHVARLQMVYETNDALHLVMEHLEGGELYDRLDQAKWYSEERAADTAYQMLLAVGYLHRRHVAHRDLKLENFLYERTGTDHLKLIDFGFARFWDSGTVMSQACGSKHYVAPEVLLHSYTVQADMWSIGVIVYMMLTGSPCFYGTDTEILRKIKECKPHFSSYFQCLSAHAQAFVQELLVFDPQKRLTASRALAHPWIQGRHQSADERIDLSIVKSLRDFSRASHFRRMVLSKMAWSLSTEDQAALRRQFLLMDTQKRGTITLRDLPSALGENFHIGNNKANDLFGGLNPETCEEIEYTEFLAATLLGRLQAHEEVRFKTFAHFDSRGGITDFDEFIAYFQKTEALGCLKNGRSKA